ncbi:MAG: SpoIIE family protein phosphatase [Coriobacteriia bacterium]|nr:SpoIIE family protein phosphatase [Coriobacteriia bacterium]
MADAATPHDRDSALTDLGELSSGNPARTSGDLETAGLPGEERYRLLFDSLLYGYCTVEMIFDDDNNPLDYRFVEVNRRFEQQTGLHDVQGKRIRELAPDNDPYWYEIYGRVALTGEPARFEAPATALGRNYEVSAFRVGAPASRLVGIVFSDITDRMVAAQLVKDELARTQLLLESASALAEATSVEGALQQLARLVLEATGIKRAFVNLIDVEREILMPRIATGGLVLPTGGEIPFGQLSETSLSAIRAATLTILDYELPETPEKDRAIAKANACRVALFVPLQTGGQLVGHVTLDEPGQRHDFTDREMDIVAGIASHASTVVKNALLLDFERESVRLSQALNEVNRAVHSTLEIDEVMQHALEAGSKALACDAATIEMREGDEWIVRHQTGFSPEDVGWRLSEKEAPIATRAAGLKHPFAIENMCGDETVDVGFVNRYGPKSVLAVPLHAKGEVIGCALFYSSAAVRRFTDAEIDFGGKLGSAVSLALENARLYSIERNTAQTLQGALLTLPESVHGIDFAASYRPATESTLVGGDFYDLFELDYDRLGITIGDISGKGLKAAVLTSLVKDTIRAHAHESGKTPAQILTLANDLVQRSTAPEVFATVFFGILDRVNGRLSYASAGHTTAAILKPEGTVVTLPCTNPILGAFASVEFGECEARVGSNEILFLYTDGLTEARQAEEMYGEDRLLDRLASSGADCARDVVDEVMADVLTFSSGQLRDDLAILAVRRLEAPPHRSQ